MRPSPEEALREYFESLRDTPVPKSIEIRIEKPLRDATVGAAAGILLLLFLIGLGAEIEVPENAAPIIGADAYAQLQRTEPVRRTNDTSQGETWKTGLA